MLAKEIIEDIQIVSTLLHTLQADASDIDGTVNVEQGLIQIELEIGRTYPERHKIVQVVEDGWFDYRNRRGTYQPVIREAVRIIPELFTGLLREDVKRLCEFVVKREGSKTYTFPRTLYQVLLARPQGERRLLLAITGSPYDIAVPLCKELGFDAAVGCYMLTDNRGRYTGERDERPACDKGAVMDELAEKLGIVWNYGVAVGDSPTDIPMFQRCSFRLAVNPTMDLQAWMRDHHEVNVAWVADHQKTGTQIKMPDDLGRYNETDLYHALPHDLARAFPPLPGMWRNPATQV